MVCTAGEHRREAWAEHDEGPCLSGCRGGAACRLSTLHSRCRAVCVSCPIKHRYTTRDSIRVHVVNTFSSPKSARGEHVEWPRTAVELYPVPEFAETKKRKKKGAKTKEAISLERRRLPTSTVCRPRSEAVAAGWSGQSRALRAGGCMWTTTHRNWLGRCAGSGRGGDGETFATVEGFRFDQEAM